MIGRVADVGVDAGEEGELRFFCRDGDSGLGHEREQAEGLERDGFATGVGAADDELAGVVREDDGEGNGGYGVGACFECRGAHAEFQQWMAGVGEG